MGSYGSKEMPLKASTFLSAGLIPFRFDYKASSEESGPYLTAEMMSPSDQNHSQYPSSRQPHSLSQNLTNTSLQSLCPRLNPTVQSLRTRPDPTLRLSPTNQLYTNPSSPPSTSHFLEGWTTAFPTIPTQQQTPFQPFQPFLQYLPLPDLIPPNDGVNEVPPFSPFELPKSPLTFDILESGLSSCSQSPLERPGPLSTPDISSVVSSGYISCNASSLFLFERPNSSITFDVSKRSPALQPSESSPTSDLIQRTWELGSAQLLPSSHSPTPQLCETITYFDNTEGSIRSASQVTPSLSCPMESQQTDSQRGCHVESIHRMADRCEECKIDFKERRDLEDHMRLKHKSAAVIHQCPHCQTRLADRQTLKVHVSAQHEGIRHPCSQCDRKYKYFSDLTRHMKEKHSGEANARYPCLQCECKYGSRSRLAMHIKEKHTPNAVLCDCPHCPKKFPNDSRLKLHINAIHENVLHHCSQCECKYAYPTHLTRHMKRKHTPDANVRYPCSQCERKYDSGCSLAKHIKQKHTPNAVLYECPHCHEKFPNGARLKLHVNAIHENVLYHCSQCDLKYKYSTDLTRHMKHKHTPDAVLKGCPHCHKKFTENHGLQSHINAVHKNVRYPCSQCTCTYSCPSYLKKHIKQKHEQAP